MKSAPTIEPRVIQLYADTTPPYYIGEIDWLMYRSYEHNRTLSPHVPVESWRKIYYNADIYEKIYSQGVNHDNPSN